jgi:Tfp pilus assembly protein PilF
VILSLVRLPLSRWLGPVLLPLLLAGCETFSAATPPAPPASDSIALLYQRPAERALINGLRAYEEGSFERAEQAFRTALLQQLRDRRDTAIAHKYLAFIACAFNRLTECEQQFRNAFAADPNFLLTDAEIGHPIWGPVYRRVSGQAKR